MSSEKRVLCCTTAELAPGALKLVEREEGNLTVYNLDGTFYVTEDRCSHGLASLAEGGIVGEEVECPMHFGAFSIKTGQPTAAPCSMPIKTFPVVIEGDQVFAVTD